MAVIDPSTEPPTLYKCTEEDTLIIRGEKDTKQHTKMICDNQNERGYVQLTADRRTKSAHQLWSFPATCFPRDCVYCLREYARNSARVEAIKNASKTNTAPNTHQRQIPRRSRYAAHDKRLCQLLSTSTGKYPFPKATQQVWTDVVLCAAPLDLRRLFCSGLMWCCVQHRCIFGDCSVLTLKRSYLTTVAVHCYYCCGSPASYSTTVTFLNLKRSLQLSPHLRSSLNLGAPVVWTTTGLRVRATSCPGQLRSKNLRNRLSWTTTFSKRCATSCPGQRLERDAQLVVLDNYSLKTMRH